MRQLLISRSLGKSLCAVLWLERCQRCCEWSRRIVQGRGQVNKGTFLFPWLQDDANRNRLQMSSSMRLRPQAAKQQPTTTASRMVTESSRPPFKPSAESISSSTMPVSCATSPSRTWKTQIGILLLQSTSKDLTSVREPRGPISGNKNMEELSTLPLQLVFLVVSDKQIIRLLN